MPRTCSSHRRPADALVRTPEAALSAVILATESGRTACVCVGTVDAERRPGVLVTVEGAGTPEVPAVVAFVLEGARELTASLFVASSGPDATVPDEELFAVLEGQCREAGVGLLEWFVPVGRFWMAVGERRGRRSQW